MSAPQKFHAKGGLVRRPLKSEDGPYWHRSIHGLFL